MPHFSSSALLFAHPLQGATVYALPISTGSKFLLTRPSRGATILYLILCIVYSISTHTPLAGRDCNNLCLEFLNKNFYSHAPRGALQKGGRCGEYDGYFYSHAPRGARPLHLAHAASAPVTYWGGPGFSLVYRAHGGPFRAKNRIFSGEPPGISQL